MRAFYDVETVRAAEAPLLAALPEHALMRRAAHGLAQASARELRAHCGSVAGRSVVLLVGGGDNGGDALFAGADLRARGAAVTAVLLAPQRAHAAGLEALRASGGCAVSADDVRGGRLGGALRGRVDRPALVIDGIVGISGRPGLRPDARGLVDALASQGAPVFVAADLPSGVDPATGSTDGPAVDADVTVAFGAYKPVHVLGARHCGRVELVEIGLDLPGLGAPGPGPGLRQMGDDDAGGLWPVPGGGDDKYTQGVTGVAAGSQTYPGAAVLSVGAAVAATSAMVRYAGTARESVLAAWPEAIATDAVVQAGRVQAWAIGPGGGTDAAAAERLRAVLATDLPVVVDADGLTVLAEHPEWVRERSDRLAPTVLTPHAGEFARLARGSGVRMPDGDTADDSARGGLPEDRLGAVRALAANLGATVLLKGHVTVIAGPGQRPSAAGREASDQIVYAEYSGHSWAATAGSGDVLTGIIGALLAAGDATAAAPERACAAATRVHSVAAGLAAVPAGVSAPVPAVGGASAPVSASTILEHLRPAIRRVRWQRPAYPR